MADHIDEYFAERPELERRIDEIVDRDLKARADKGMKRPHYDNSGREARAMFKRLEEGESLSDDVFELPSQRRDRLARERAHRASKIRAAARQGIVTGAFCKSCGDRPKVPTSLVIARADKIIYLSEDVTCRVKAGDVICRRCSAKSFPDPGDQGEDATPAVQDAVDSGDSCRPAIIDDGDGPGEGYVI